jgi:integrase
VTRSSLASTEEGCKCKPSYFTFYRDKGGRPVKGSRVRSRRVAERSAHALQAELDAGRLLRRDSNIDFAEWADSWLERHRAKENTLRLYRHSLAVAKRAFTGLTLREIANSDISRFLDLLQKDGEARGRLPTSTTLNKHFRNLHACLEAAVPEYVATNPADHFHSSLRPRAESDRWDYFGNEELSRLWQSFEQREDQLGLYLSKTAVTTGLRLGELLALTRRDVDLAGKVLTVRGTFRVGLGLSSPKSGKARSVYLSPDATEVLRQWFEIRSASLFDRDALVFANRAGKNLDHGAATKRTLYKAMRDAKPPEGKRLKTGEWGIPKIGERGNPRTFHSFRHTYARLVLEAGGDRFWLQQQLGHSSAAMTERYSMWSKEAERRQADQLAAGSFPV